jgi:hypothetical protein
MVAHEIPVAPEHAAEILRPRAIHRAVDDDVADLARAQILRHRRQTQASVDLAVGEQLVGPRR